MDSVRTVQAYYDTNVEQEWERLDRHPFEMAINLRFIKRYVAPGQRVLDLGGGPGRYALALSEYGCDVTLADLSSGNVSFAQAKAGALGLSLNTQQCDARNLSAFQDQTYDHVLCMGPMYHLRQEEDRVKAIQECLRVLRPGGTLHVAFISSYAGIIYAMKFDPGCIMSPDMASNMGLFARDEAFNGIGFTENYFIRHADVAPFFQRFPIEKLHLLSSEGILAPNEPSLLLQPPAVLQAWIDLASAVCERDDLLSFAEHLLYIGRKQG